MSTSLAAQLAQIAAKSKTILNVKAQKAAHSKSLIFEAPVAAGQTYQIIYSLCQDGFEELCRLDGRFVPFSKSIFSEQSQEEDRTQMNEAENAELDRKVESFLLLAGSRLRLTPTIKCLEWLIRRFRIHEFNTAALIAAFLPYHTIPAFVTLMSILPSDIPPVYRFLDPYVRSLTAPPRAAIIQQATKRPDLLAAISTHALSSCKSGHQYPALISFWGGTMTECVNELLDSMRSGRRSIQIDNDQALLRQLGPVLGDALAMKDVPGLQIASYMAVAVFASKGDMGDDALSAFMEQLVQGWSAETLRPGLVCLSILAQQRSAKQLSSKVTKALLKVQDIGHLICEIGTQRRLDKLANGLVLALAHRLVKKGNARGLPIIRSIMTGNVLQEKQIVVAFKSLLLAAHSITDETDENGSLRKQLGSTLVVLSQTPGTVGDIIRKVIEDVEFDIDELELKLDASLRPKLLLAPTADEDSVMENGVDHQPEDFDTSLERLSSLKSSSSSSSCLATGIDPLFQGLSQVFLSVASDKKELLRFDAAPVLGRQDAASKCMYLSFYMRIWLGPFPTLARVAALEMAQGRLSADDCSGVSFQAIIPYCIAALGDSAKKVRRAAANLLVALDKSASSPQKKRKLYHWGADELYGNSKDWKWLETQAESSLLHAVVIPSVEEAVLHEEHAQNVLKSALEGSKPGQHSDAVSVHLSQSTRLSILTFLAGHACRTPILLLKLRLLTVLNQVKGAGSTSRTQLLLPVLKWWAELPETESGQLASIESLDVATLDSCFVGVVVPNDKSGLDYLVNTIREAGPTTRPHLVQSMFARIRQMWPAMKSEAKRLISQAMFDLAEGPSSSSGDRIVASEEAAELLRNVDLSTDILAQFLEALQDDTRMMAAPQPNKRRRTSTSDRSRGVVIQSSAEIRTALNKMTFIMQLVESSHPANHPELLPSLFMALSDLQTLRALAGSELGYLQNLVLSNLLAMIPAYKDNKNLKIDNSVGHGDILVQCIQKSSSPAVQNSALLLVASLARTAPNVVLHSVMPIFTFMGSSVLRQGDDYSAHVIDQTIKEIIPPLIETFRKGKKNVVASASDLLSSFVTAYEHIPSHRKQGLFVSLIVNLGPADFLFAILAMFADKYGTTDSILAFLADLMNSFSVEVQLQSLVLLVGLIRDIFSPKPTLSAVLLSTKENGEQNLQSSAEKELTLLPHLLSNRRLKLEIGKMAGEENMETAKVRELYATLLEDVLTLAETVKTRQRLHEHCGKALENLLNLKSIGEFIKAIETLLDRPDVGLRRKVLRALELRAEHERKESEKSRYALLGFLPQLTAVIRDSTDIKCKYLAVNCVDIIAEKYGKKDLEAVTAAASTIASDDCLGQSDRQLRRMALLCLASLVSVLQDAIVPVLPVAISKCLGYLRDSLNGIDTDVEIHDAAYSFATALADHLPYMLSANYLDQILISSNDSAEAGIVDNVDNQPNKTRMEFLQSVASSIEGRIIFPVLERNWPHAMKAGHLALGEYLDVLGTAIDNHDKPTITKNIGPLAAIFKSGLDLRRDSIDRETSSALALARTAELENSFNKVMLKMVYKLNDASFRPLFSDLMEWSMPARPVKGDTGRIQRQQSVFSFLYAFFDDLKSIVTSYASYIIDGSVAILKSINVKDADQRELWKRVLQTLAKCFEHDQDSFWQAPAHFSGVASVLAAQFLHAPKTDVSEDLVPAIVQLAVAADSQEHHKELNSMLLKHMRSEETAVKLAVVQCQKALTDKLPAEWLTMLPEMLAYIGELQQDDYETVERETRRWMVMIEEALGESLDSMLQ